MIADTRKPSFPEKMVVVMISVIEVQCPHCGARGTIIAPPLGSILIGPCPLCKEMVVLFSGRVMPLDKRIMLGDDIEAKHNHLLDVLHSYIDERIEEVLNSREIAAFSVETESELELEKENDNESEFDDEFDSLMGDERYDTVFEYPEVSDELLNLKPISREEVDDFVRIDLPLLAKDKYFRMFFGD